MAGGGASVERAQVGRMWTRRLSVKGGSARSPARRLRICGVAALAGLFCLSLAQSAYSAGPPTGNAGASIAAAPAGAVAGALESDRFVNCAIKHGRYTGLTIDGIPVDKLLKTYMAAQS